MAASINYKLGQLANEYYISYGTSEQKKIDASVATLKVILSTLLNLVLTRETLYCQESMMNILMLI